MHTNPLLLIFLPSLLFFIIGVGEALVEISFYLFKPELFKKKLLIQSIIVAIIGPIFLMIHETRFDKKKFF